MDPSPEVLDNPLSYYDLHPHGQESFQDDLIKRVPEIPNFSIVPSPGSQQQAAAIIESAEMQAFIKYARTQYDVIILDTPSLDRCNDALLLESFADGLILVTHPGITQKNLFNTTIDEFLDAELPLIGVVINEVKTLGVKMDSGNLDNDGNNSSGDSSFPFNNTEEVESQKI
jgi:Mrp family chromosome partitioning ATPase